LILILVVVQTLGRQDFLVTTNTAWYKIEGADVWIHFLTCLLEKPRV